MSTTKCDVKVACTPERRQEKYAELLEDALDESTRHYEKVKAEFVASAAKSGYDYAMKWRMEAVLQAEHLVRFMAPAVAMLKLLVEGQATQAQTVENLELHAQELTGELIRGRTWEHHCTCAFTNLAALQAATAKAQAVEKIQQLSYRLSRIG